MCDYYSDPEGHYLPWSKAIVDPLMAENTMAIGQFGELSFELTFTESGRTVSPWHDISLRPSGYSVAAEEFNFVVEIPMFQTAKMEVNKELAYNPITQVRCFANTSWDRSEWK